MSDSGRSARDAGHWMLGTKGSAQCGVLAWTASGSVVTEDVPDDAVAFGRARQEVKLGRAKILRERYQAEKAARKK